MGNKSNTPVPNPAPAPAPAPPPPPPTQQLRPSTQTAPFRANAQPQRDYVPDERNGNAPHSNGVEVDAARRNTQRLSRPQQFYSLGSDSAAPEATATSQTAPTPKGGHTGCHYRQSTIHVFRCSVQ